MRKPIPRHLRIVEPEAVRKTISSDDFRAPSTQGTLFASQSPSLLIFADFEALSEAEIISLIASSKPRTVLDIRAVPRFDVGAINRKVAFALFDNIGARYFDVAGKLKLKRSKKEPLDPTAFAIQVKTTILHGQRPPHGPIVVLADTAQAQYEFMQPFSIVLDDLIDSGWELMRIPETAVKAALDHGRTIIFISHATPDDNDFARWLGTQLQLLGYEVWTDFERLIGGEVFWDEIEDIIRNRAAKVIVAITRLAQQRNGVLDELNLAISVERALGLESFVIPVRVDNLPYDQFRANIARKNILDFSENWAGGLLTLLKALERDRVPRLPELSQGGLARTVHSRLANRYEVQEVAETLLLNWIAVIKLPTAINVFELSAPSGKLNSLSKLVLVPHARYGDVIISFASPDFLTEHLPLEVSARRRASLLTTGLLQGQPPELPSLGRSEAIKLVNSLIRQGWDAKARRCGLQPYELATSATAWFAPDGLLPANKVTFFDSSGQKRRKSLVGFSPKRGVHWHFAVEMKVMSGRSMRLIARPHVVFSEDGKRPLESSARMHALRRGFCKTWWNDRWRDLLVGYLSIFEGENQTIDVAMGSPEPMLLSARFTTAICPVRPNDELKSSEYDSGLEGGDDRNDLEDADLDDEEIEHVKFGEGLLPKGEP